MRGETVEVACAACGKPFTARVADRARGWAKCCSKSCAAIRRERTNQPSPAQLRQRRLWAQADAMRNEEGGAYGLSVAGEGWDEHKNEW